MKYRYLVTGGSGFIGAYLVRELVAKGEKVSVILRKQANLARIRDILPKLDVITSDLSDLSSLTDQLSDLEPHVIYHFATNGAYSQQSDANQIITTNILGTWNLLQACKQIDYKLFVNVGSSSEYGYKQFAMRETDILEPASYYAVTKCAQTLLCSHIARSEKKPIVTIRPFSVFGPYEENSRFIPTLLRSIKHRTAMNLVSAGISRDYIYVSDLISALLSVDRLAKHGGDYFNIGTGVQHTIKQVVQAAVEVTGQTTKFNWGKMESRKWDTDNWVADISKARNMLKWYPTVSLKDGLKLHWNWINENHE